ncbi:MAG: cation-efflux pump [Lentisphaeria bacterium]|nr:cation-efflux pump [Lentisphaeria bacterium]
MQEQHIIQRVTAWGMAMNLLLTGFKFAIGVLYHSQACVADGVHSLSDMMTDVAVMIGLRFWGEPADSRHPHGHQRIEALVTLFIGAVLGLVALSLGWKALVSIGHDTHRLPGWPVFAVAMVSIVVKEVLYQWTVAAARRCHSRAMMANAWHHRSDAFSSIPVAAAVVVGRLWPAMTHVDACAALLVSLMLLKAAWDIAWPMLRELADEGADAALLERIQNLAMTVPGVREVHDLRTRRVGEGYALDLHVLVDSDLSVEDGHLICDDIQASIGRGESRIVDVLCHLEPMQPVNVRERIRQVALAVPGVLGVHRVRTRRVLNGYDADLHVQVAPDMSVRDGHAICGTVTRALAQADLKVVGALIHLEPHEGQGGGRGGESGNMNSGEGHKT